MAGKKQEGFTWFGDDWGRPSAEQRAANRTVVSDWWNQINQPRAGSSIGEMLSTVTEDTRDWRRRGNDLLATNPFGGPTQAAAYAMGSLRDKMMESGGEKPPVATPPAAVSPQMFTKAPAAMQAPAQPKSPLQEVLSNIAANNPNAKLTFGQIQKLGSVFPGVSSTSKMSGKDAAIYAAMQADQEQFVKHLSGIEAQERSGQLDAQAAAELRDAAAINRKNFLARMGIGQTDDKTNLAEYFKDAQKE